MLRLRAGNAGVRGVLWALQTERESSIVSEKHQPGPGPLESIAGSHATIENLDNQPGNAMPFVGDPGWGYSLPPRADGMIYSRPFLCTSIKSDRPRATGWVFIEPGDTRPTVVEGPGVVMLFVRDIPMGNPAEPDKIHKLAKNYPGRSDGPGLTPEGSTEVAQEVPVETGNVDTQPLTPPTAGKEFDPADKNQDGTTTRQEKRDFKREQKG